KQKEMLNPSFVTRIEGKEVSCLGKQLEQLLQMIEPFIKNLVWYASDVEINNEYPNISLFSGFKPKKIGELAQLKKMCRNVQQFYSGVFLGSPQDVGEFIDEEFDTEDEQFRSINDFIIEIRAFDTTFFEVFSNDLNIMNHISHHYD